MVLYMDLRLRYISWLCQIFLVDISVFCSSAEKNVFVFFCCSHWSFSTSKIHWCQKKQVSVVRLYVHISSLHGELFPIVSRWEDNALWRRYSWERSMFGTQCGQKLVHSPALICILLLVTVVLGEPYLIDSFLKKLLSANWWVAAMDTLVLC